MNKKETDQFFQLTSFFESPKLFGQRVTTVGDKIPLEGSFDFLIYNVVHSGKFSRQSLRDNPETQNLLIDLINEKLVENGHEPGRPIPLLMMAIQFLPEK